MGTFHKLVSSGNSSSESWYSSSRSLTDLRRLAQDSLRPEGDRARLVVDMVGRRVGIGEAGETERVTPAPFFELSKEEEDAPAELCGAVVALFNLGVEIFKLLLLPFFLIDGVKSRGGGGGGGAATGVGARGPVLPCISLAVEDLGSPAALPLPPYKGPL